MSGNKQKNTIQATFESHIGPKTIKVKITKTTKHPKLPISIKKTINKLVNIREEHQKEVNELQKGQLTTIQLANGGKISKNKSYEYCPSK